MSHKTNEIDLGTCCACGEKRPFVRNIAFLPFAAPVPGTGWGCFQCGLPTDGALAIICDACVELEAKIRFVVVGLAAEGQRMPIDELKKRPFKHQMAYHLGESLP